MGSGSGHPDNSDDMAKDILLASLKDLSAVDFASRQLLDRVPWLFSNRTQYIEWKTALATDLEVDPYMLLVVGSAAVGFSLSPWKRFTPFGQHSDIDVAVISTRHFDDAWRWLRGLKPSQSLSRFERDMFTRHRQSLVFDGAIATDKLLGRLSFGPEWAAALGRAGKREPTIGRSVKVRIYRDFESLREYHVANINDLQLQLISTDVGSSTAKTVLPGSSRATADQGIGD